MALPIIQFVVGIGIGILGIGFLLLRQRSIEAPHQSSHRRDSNPQTFRTEPGENCVICIEPMSISNIHYLPCKHAIHTRCFNSCKQYDSKCPICRTPF